MRTEARHERLKTVRDSKKRKHEGGEQNSPAQQSPSKSTSSAPPVKKVKLNTIDPIMMVPIGKKNCFKFVRPNGTVVRFNIESLVDYLIASGDFNDPETRIPFSDADLTEIDAIVRVLKHLLIQWFCLSNTFIIFHASLSRPRRVV